MARRISFQTGSRLFYGTIEYEVLGPESLTTVKVKDVISGEVRSLPTAGLKLRAPDKPEVSSFPLDYLTEEDQATVLERFKIIKPAIVGNLSRQEVEELAKKHGVHFTTIYRMIKKYRETMSPASLLPKISARGGKGQIRINTAVNDLIKNHFQEILDAKLVDIAKLPVKSLQLELKKKCKTLGLKPPSWSTVNERLTDFIHENKLEAKKKRKGGRHRTMSGGTFPDANWPLDVVQIDHTPLDMIIVDEDREPIGRPYLSIAIDVFSRMVVGFSLSFDSPSIFSVGRLIAHCILPKTSFLEQVAVKAEWDVSGFMGTIHLDNASEFRADSFIPFQEEYLVDFRWRPVATPEYGGHIERLAKTLNDMIHEEPGSTMGNIIEKAGYDSAGHACYTIDEIEKWLTILITKVYHVKPHSGLKTPQGEEISPVQKYWTGIIGDEKANIPGIGLPDQVEDEERLKLFLLPSSSRTVRTDGIELDRIFYFHDILRNMVGKKGDDGKAKKYLIKRDPRRISPIFIFDPEKKEYFAIPYKDLTKPPITLWELEAAKKRCREKGIDDATEQQIFDALSEMRQIRDQSVSSTKKAKREKAAQKRRSKDSPVYPQLSVKKPQQVNTDDEVIDSSSFYDDESLLDGVIVNSGNLGG